MNRNDKMIKCPRCKDGAYNFKNLYPAVSRRDNKTNICSECGVQEALFDFKMDEFDKEWEEISDKKIESFRLNERKWLEDLK